MYVWAVKATSAYTSYRWIRSGVLSGTKRLVLCDFENLRSTLNINFNQPILKKLTLQSLQYFGSSRDHSTVLGCGGNLRGPGGLFGAILVGALPYKPEHMAHAASDKNLIFH